MRQKYICKMYLWLFNRCLIGIYDHQIYKEKNEKTECIINLKKNTLETLNECVPYMEISISLQFTTDFQLLVCQSG